jgi:hypothetical protein
MRAIFLGVLFLVAACAPVQMRSQIDRPTRDAYASTGDIVLRAQNTEDLPNVFGRADLFGRTRDRGFTEVRYMGLKASGVPLFRRRDVNIVTNETTMSQTGSFAEFQAHGSRAQFAAAGSSYIAPIANVNTLPPDTLEFALDLRQSRLVTVGQNGFEVLEANPAGLRYRAY